MFLCYTLKCLSENMVSMITVLVVDDHPLLRQGVVDSLTLERDFAVIGQAGSGEAALDLIRRLQPTVAVVDINLPGINGQQVARQVVAESLSTRVILLTAYDDQLQKTQGIRAGARAYCTKDIQPELLVEVVRVVATGSYVVDGQEYDEEGIQAWLNTHMEKTMEVDPYTGGLKEPLSQREMDVLMCLARGLSNKEISSQLGISNQTVKNHVTSLLRKLGVEDRTQATLYALQKGWVRLN
jgi:DNA-binding NarL/FixJ family response regulator